MKRILGALAALLFCMVSAPAGAQSTTAPQGQVGGTVIYRYGQQLPSSSLNQDDRNKRIADGTRLYHAMAASGLTAFYANACTTTATGLTVQVGPCSPNTFAGIYQLVPEDPTPYGGPGASALPADATQIIAQGLMNSNSAAIGPLSASTTYTVETQLQRNDVNSQPINYVGPNGVVTTGGSALRDRIDAIQFRAKVGTTPDSGWFALSQVVCPGGVTLASQCTITPNTANQYTGVVLSGKSATFPTVNATTVAATTITSSTVTASAGLQGATVTATGLAPGCATILAGGVFGSTGQNCGTSTSVTQVLSGHNTAVTAGQSPVVNTVDNPVFTTSVTSPQYVATSGNNLVVNSAAASNGFVAMQLNAPNQTLGLRVYDGGSSNFSSLTGSGASINGPLSSGAHNATSVSSTGSVTAGNAVAFSPGDVGTARNGSNGSIDFGSNASQAGALLYDAVNYNFYVPGAGSVASRINAVNGTYSVGGTSVGPSSSTLVGLLTSGQHTANGPVASNMGAGLGQYWFGPPNGAGSYLLTTAGDGYYRFTNIGAGASVAGIRQSDGAYLTGGATYGPSGLATGTGSFTGALYAPYLLLNGSTAGTANMLTDGTNLLFRAYAPAGATYMETAAGGLIAHFNAAGETLDAGSYLVGSTSVSSTNAVFGGTGSFAAQLTANAGLNVGGTTLRDGSASFNGPGAFAGNVTSPAHLFQSGSGATPSIGIDTANNAGAGLNFVIPSASPSYGYRWFQNGTSTLEMQLVNSNLSVAGRGSFGYLSGIGDGITGIPASALSFTPTQCVNPGSNMTGGGCGGNLTLGLAASPVFPGLVSTVESGLAQPCSQCGALGWNFTNGGGEATIATGYNGAYTTSFYHWNGSAMANSSVITSDGTYNEANGASYGSSSSVPGTMTSGGFYQSSRREVKANIVAQSPEALLRRAVAPEMQVFAWCYLREQCAPGQQRHLGPMANEAWPLLLDANGQHLDQGGVTALALGSVQALEKQNRALRARVDRQQKILERVERQLARRDTPAHRPPAHRVRQRTAAHR